MHVKIGAHKQEIICRVADTTGQVHEAKRLCHDVYLAAGYIKKPLTGGIIPYSNDASATYIVTLNDQQQVVGTIRLTAGCPYQIFEAWAGKLYDVQNTLMQAAINGKAFEIGALAVHKDWAYTGVSFALYKAAYDYSLYSGLEYAVVGMDQRALGSLIKYGWNFIQIGEPMEYYSSMCVPAILPIGRQFNYGSPSDISTLNRQPL